MGPNPSPSLAWTPSHREVLRRPSDDSLARAWTLLRQAVEHVEGRLELAMSTLESHAQLASALTQLHQASGHRLPVTHLAEQVGCSGSVMTKLADRMVAAGLVVREPSERDRRVVYLVLTDAGCEAATSDGPDLARELRRSFSALDARAVEELARACDALVNTPTTGSYTGDAEPAPIPRVTRYPVVQGVRPGPVAQVIAGEWAPSGSNRRPTD